MTGEGVDPSPATSPGTGVLYIGALGRSGSTLLNLLLTTVPGFFAVGELRYLWDRGLMENQLCGCGNPFRDCEMWREVGEVAFGGWDAVDGAAMVALDRKINRNRRVLSITRGRLRDSQLSRLNEYREVLRSLYLAIQEVSGCTVIVDSSKTPAFAAILAGIDGLDLRIVHLIRDPRGVAYSRTKRVVRPEVVGAEAQMGRFAPVRTGALWLYFNGLFEWLRRRGTAMTRLRYEDLADEADGELDKLLGSLPWQASARIPLGELTANHTVSGNPMRFERGALRITRDDAWRRELPLRHRIAVSLVTAPLLGRYGYGFRR
ncbi:MAG: sulfotransferase [Acidimicrobiales bacterium]